MKLLKKLIAGPPFRQLYDLGYLAARQYCKVYGRMYPQSEAKAAQTLLDDYGLGLSIKRKMSVDRHGQPLPWYSLPAIEFLKTLDCGDKNIYEFGCGSSSLFWSPRAQSVTGVEDNAQWYEFCQSRSPVNVTLSLQPEKSGYVNHIRETGRQYDIIVIDGKWRDECCQSAIDSLTADGCIILDNSDRAQEFIEYQKAVEFLSGQQLLQVDFTGFSPGVSYVTSTSIFFRRSFNFAPAGPFRPLKSTGHIFECSPRFAAVRLELLRQHAPLKITIGGSEQAGCLPLERSFFNPAKAGDWAELFEIASIDEIILAPDTAADEPEAVIACACMYLRPGGRLDVVAEATGNWRDCLEKSKFVIDTSHPGRIGGIKPGAPQS